MNMVVLVGRLTKDPELRYTASTQTAMCSFTIAVDRRFKSDNQPTADFISVVAWRQTAEFICKYFTKGSRIALSGQIQTRTWDDQEGKRHYVTEVLAENVEFCESKRSDPSFGGAASSFNNDRPAPAAGGSVPAPQPDGYFTIDGDDSDVPF